MIDPKFEKITALSLTAAQATKLRNGIAKWGFAWNHSSFGWLKEHLKTELRRLQRDRCCYCRRPLRFDKGPVEIEHVVSKAAGGAYAHFTFVLKNLALSCKDCNNGKGQKAVLRAQLPPNSRYPTSAATFLWVHPHFHDYSDHILIHDAWVYEAKGGSPEGDAVIGKCKLALLSGIERANRRMLVESSDGFAAALPRAVEMAGDVGLDALCVELSPLLSKMMGSGGSPAKAEAAIRAAHAAIQTIAVATSGP
ncbi:HNH endonuclease [Duganella sp. HH101]|uniref:HNH endonuclease n=1 Tax=Duganella sp. HH101 TaxID=1781066 RepID=UPI000874CE6E|nr:HNH endonuclease [Duganella sp. HH101]OFA05654.1 HNH endonuclease [Duganella sp. HH101]